MISRGPNPSEMRSAFLLEAEHHLHSQDRARLRLIILLHLLFAEELVLTDSQVLNNKEFRALASPEAGDQSLIPLFEEGALRVAVRNGRSLAEIAEDQRSRQVQDSAPAAYASRLDMSASPRSIEWDLARASEGFKEHALWRLEDLGSASGADLWFRDKVVEWIKRQERLYYNDLRTYLAQQPLTPSNRLIDQLVANEYGRTIPRLCGLYIAEEGDAQSPADYFGVGEDQPELVEFGASRALRGLRPSILGNLPIDVFLEARNLAAVRELSRQFELRQTITSYPLVPLGNIEDRLEDVLSSDRDHVEVGDRFHAGFDTTPVGLSKIDENIRQLVLDIVEVLDDVARVRTRLPEYSPEGLSVSMRFRMSLKDVYENSFALIEFVAGAITSGVAATLGHPLISLALAASSIYGTSLADKKAREAEARRILHRQAEESGVEVRGHFPASAGTPLSRRVVPPSD